MKSTITTLDDNKVKVSVEVDETEIDSAIDVAFRKLAKEIRLPGFRPGKAPRKVLEARIGADYARGEAINDVIPEYYRQALIEHDVDVISPPDIDVTDGQETGPVSFEAIVEVRPSVVVAGYQGLRIEIPSPVASDEEIDAQVDALRAQFAERVEVDREAADGDFVTMNVVGSVDGEPVEGLTAEDYTYEVGAGFVVAEMDDHLRGAVAGAEIGFDADHPDPETDDELHFDVTVLKVEENKLPEITDEFVAEATEFETAEAFLADTRERIETMKKQQSAGIIADKTGEALAELVDAEIPSGLVDEQVQRQFQDMAMRLAQQGIEFQQFLEITGQSQADIVENLRGPAEIAAKVDLALRAVAESEGFDVDDDEMHAELEATAAQIGQDPKQLLASFEENGQLSSVRWDMRKHKAMEFLTESVELVDEDGKTVDRADLEVPEPDVADAAADGAEASEPEASPDDSADPADAPEGDEA